MIRAAVASIIAAALVAQSPGWREKQTASQTFEGTRANADIPAKFHIRNEGGSDGSGLCVIASMVIGGAAQQVSDLGLLKGSRLWSEAKKRPGGYWPEKFARLAADVMPAEVFDSYEGPDSSVVERWNREGYALGVTMNTGELYRWKTIAHMVTANHVDGELACIVDNNNPGVYSWMPRAEFEKRWKTRGVGWVMRWRNAKVAVKVASWGLVALAAALLARALLRWLAARPPAFRMAGLAILVASVAAFAAPAARAQAPAPAWYVVKIDGRDARVFGTMGADGLVRYDPATVAFLADRPVVRPVPDAPPPTPDSDPSSANGQEFAAYEVSGVDTSKIAAGRIITNDASAAPGLSRSYGVSVEVVGPAPTVEQAAALAAGGDSQPTPSIEAERTLLWTYGLPAAFVGAVVFFFANRREDARR